MAGALTGQIKVAHLLAELFDFLQLLLLSLRNAPRSGRIVESNRLKLVIMKFPVAVGRLEGSHLHLLLS